MRGLALILASFLLYAFIAAAVTFAARTAGDEIGAMFEDIAAEIIEATGA